MSIDGLGWVHTVFAAVALAAGAAVVLLPKGTRWHRTLGHLYVTSMVGLLASAFFIYDLTGGFGVFHVAAVVAAVTLGVGIFYVLARRPRRSWMEGHAIWMSWSYIGLLCAFTAESLTRFALPLLAPYLSDAGLWPAFWTLVAVASGGTAALGALVLKKRLPGTVQGTPRAIREERRSLRELERNPDGGGA